MEITFKREIPAQMIADLVVTCIEGGSNYWLNSFKPAKGQRDRAVSESPWYAASEIYDFPDFKMVCQVDDEKSVRFLTLEVVRTGFQTMAIKYPNHFGDLVKEEGDSTTADIWLQCCLFGEIIYG